MENKNNIDKVLEDFDKKFCPNDIWDTKLITFELKDWLKRKLQQVSDRKVEDIGNRVECASFSEEPDFECGRVLPISEMMSTVKNPDTFYCKECYQRGVDMENEAMGL